MFVHYEVGYTWFVLRGNSVPVLCMYETLLSVKSEIHFNFPKNYTVFINATFHLNYDTDNFKYKNTNLILVQVHFVLEMRYE